MKVRDVMSMDVATCGPSDSLARAAQIMWERDCGSLPVLGAGSRVIGVVTDRDACMSAYTRGRRMDEIPVAGAMSNLVVCCNADDDVEFAHRCMRDSQVRRLPVIDGDGMLIGLVSLGGLAQAAIRESGASARTRAATELLSTLSHVTRPRSAPAPTEAPHGALVEDDMPQRTLEPAPAAAPRGQARKGARAAGKKAAGGKERQR